jgi:hypothetical protein
MHRKSESKGGQSGHSANEHRPEEFIVDPTMSNFLLLDQISRRFGKSLEIQLEMVRLLYENQRSLHENQKSLNALLEKTDGILEKTDGILKEAIADADEGGYITKSDTVSNSNFYIIDTQIAPGHPIKSYVVSNEGKNSIYVGHNVAPSSVGPDILDANVNNPLDRFNLLKDCEHFQYEANRKTIKNIYLLAAKGMSQFRITLIW